MTALDDLLHAPEGPEADDGPLLDMAGVPFRRRADPEDPDARALLTTTPSMRGVGAWLFALVALLVVSAFGLGVAIRNHNMETRSPSQPATAPAGSAG